MKLHNLKINYDLEHAELRIVCLLSHLSRGTISVISFSLLMSSSLQGAHSEPIIPTMNWDSSLMSRVPFSACCWMRGRSRTSSIRARKRPWPGSKKDSSVCMNREAEGDWRQARKVRQNDLRQRYCNPYMKKHQRLLQIQKDLNFAELWGHLVQSISWIK